MGFIGVYKALYDYTPQSEGELQVTEGDIVYVLEKSTEDAWWKAKKKASGDDEDEPEGLIPNNYIEEAQPISHARALYEYTRQTNEELSFSEDAQLQVFDTSDPDWILVGHDGEYGFVPANYVDVGGDGGASAQQQEEEEEEPPLPARPFAPSLPARTPRDDDDNPPLPPRDVPSEPSSPAAPNPAAALAGVLGGRSASSSARAPPALQLPPRPQVHYEDDEDEESVRSPPLPNRPRGGSSPPPSRAVQSPVSPDFSPRERENPQLAALTPGGFHMYNINEMVSVMGKRKKMPTTLGVNLKTGMILVAPERSQDGPSQEWSADRMTHYSREGKHVFMELVRPSKSFDFHAGAKDTAEEIVAQLGELAGAVRAEGLKEVIAAGTGRNQKTGVILYDFMAQGDDEVTVAIGDEVIIVDDSKSEDWWQVRRLKNGKNGVVPSSYIEITGTVPVAADSSTSGLNAGLSSVEQNRLEEERLTKQAIKAAAREDQREREREKRHSEVGPGMRLPERNSSLSTSDSNSARQQPKRENGRADAPSSSSKSSKSKPDRTKVRNWTDRSKSFSVEAQFLGVRDGKLNLHKMNGVKIAVPIAKMSVEDLEYVEQLTGLSFDEDKPLSDLKKRSAKKAEPSRIGATIQPQPKKSDYDWFQFFLSCDVAVGLCERYAQAFSRDSMDESVLPDVDAAVLRNLGLKEGDIIKVTRYLDNRYGRNKKGGDDSEGGLFSGPGGTLRNNTRKGRPAPPVETNNTINLKAFAGKEEDAADEETASPTTSAPATAAAAAAAAAKSSKSGFDDDAWDVKPSKSRTPEPRPAARAPEPAALAPAPAAAAPAPRPVPQITPGMADLSLLSQPLEPERIQPETPAPVLTLLPTAPPAAAAIPTQAQAQIPQATGANPAFFAGMAPPAMTGQQQLSQMPQQIARQRPIAPQYTQNPGGLIAPPPPTRPLSAPQSAQPSAFTPPPLQPQMTGYQPQQQIAPMGQSMNDLVQQRMQQQYAQQFQQQQQQQQQQMQQSMMPMMTGIPQQGFAQPNQFIPQPTGMMNGQPPLQAPYNDPRTQQFAPLQPQQTAFAGGFGQPAQQQFPQPTGLNSFLPSAMEPQRTGIPSLQPQPTGMGFGGFGPQPSNLNNGIGGGLQPMQPLAPQQTGPPPPVRFGVPDKKLAPQPTGRRANLAAATPQNPFGF